MAVGDLYEVVIKGRGVGGDWANVLHYKVDISVGDKWQEMEGLYEAFSSVAFDSILFDDLRNFMHPSTSITSVNITDVGDPRFGREVIVSPSVVGNRIGDALPPQLALLGRKKSNFAQRHQNGRNYWLVGTENDQSGGIWDLNTLDQLTSWLERMVVIVSTFATFFFSMQVYSRKYGVAYDVVIVGTSSQVVNQKRRMA